MHARENVHQIVERLLLRQIRRKTERPSHEKRGNAQIASAYTGGGRTGSTSNYARYVGSNDAGQIGD